MKRTGIVTFVGAVTLALTLAGCSNDPGSTGSDDDDYYSPIGEYTDVLYGGDFDEEEWNAQYVERERVVEQMVAECMTDEGFEYIPQEVDESMFSSGDGDSEENVYEPDDREWVERYGYGIVNWPGQEEAEEIPVEEEEIPVDPNAEYLESLSENERLAYEEALWGPQPTEEEMNDPDYEWPMDEGCYNVAQNEVGYPGEDTYAGLEEEFAPLMESMEEFWTTSSEDPRFAELDAAWAGCMSEAGHSGYTTQMDPQDEISNEVNAFWESLSEEEMTEGVDPYDSPEMAEIGKREVETALADLDCREEVKYTERTDEIRIELEEEFVAANKAELEAFKAAAEQAAG